MFTDFIDTIFKRIVAFNSMYDLNSIPHSDVFFKETEALFGLSTNELDIIIDIINRSHKIFIIEIAREEYNDKSETIYGYVDSDMNNMKRLQSIFHKGLMDEYERERYNRKGSAQIIKELMPNIRSLRGTIMGIHLNKAVMLDSYIHLLEKNFLEYTEEWKQEELKQQISIYESSGFLRKDFKDKDSANFDMGDAEDQGPERAIDSSFIEDFTDRVTKGSVARVLNIYGINFFFRVYLRKYKFAFLSQVIETGIIDRKSDLLVAKEMLSKLKENLNHDNELEKYYDDIMLLDRKITRSISFCKK